MMSAETPQGLVAATMELEPKGWVKYDISSNLDLDSILRPSFKEDLSKNTIVLVRSIDVIKPLLLEPSAKLNVGNTFRGSERFYRRTRRGRRPRGVCSRCHMSYRLSGGHQCRS